MRDLAIPYGPNRETLSLRNNVDDLALRRKAAGIGAGSLSQVRCRITCHCCQPNLLGHEGDACDGQRRVEDPAGASHTQPAPQWYCQPESLAQGHQDHLESSATPLVCVWLVVDRLRIKADNASLSAPQIPGLRRAHEIAEFLLPLLEVILLSQLSSCINNTAISLGPFQTESA